MVILILSLQIHASLVRSLHLIQNLSSLRSLPSGVLFYIYGCQVDTGKTIVQWPLRQIYPEGGAVLLTLELILVECHCVLRIINYLVGFETSRINSN